jgi:hypothetical protein
MLLLLLVASFIALGFDETWMRAIAVVLQFAAIAYAFAASAVREHHRWLGLAAVGAAVAVVLLTIEGDAASGIAEILGVVVLAALLVAVLDRVLQHDRVTVQTLLGAVCAYFLIGLMFSSVYAAMDDLGDAALFGEEVRRSVYSYFSFTTLTTIGFGDFTSASDLGRRVAMIEGVLGQVFIATTLARLVSMYKSADA